MEKDYRSLKAQWLAHRRDRAMGLRLMFFAWMHWADPPFVTGLTEDPEAEAIWHDVFDSMNGEASTDAEFLFAAGLMAELFPYVLGDEAEWEQRGLRMKNRGLAAPHPLTFDDRDEYGQYFAHQLAANRR